MILLPPARLHFSPSNYKPKFPNPQRNSFPGFLGVQALDTENAGYNLFELDLGGVDCQRKRHLVLIPHSHHNELLLVDDQKAPFSTEVSLSRMEQEIRSPVCGIFSEVFPKTFSSCSFRQNFIAETFKKLLSFKDDVNIGRALLRAHIFCFAQTSVLIPTQVTHARESSDSNILYDVGELFELGIQLSYLLLLLALIGVGTFFVIRQVLVRRELDLSAKELQEQVRSGDASATEYFELGAVMLRRKFYSAATKYLLQAIQKWDGDDQDLSQVYNALGVSYVLDGKLDKGITQFETAVKLQPGYVTAWNNLGDAYEKKKEYEPALKAFEEVILFDPNNKVARPRRDALKDRVKMYKGVPIKSKDRR